MKTILILGAGKEQVYAIQLAKKKSIRTIAMDKNPRAEGSHYADEFHCISTRDPESIIKFLGGYSKKIDGVMTIASDIPHCVSAVAEFLHIPHIPLSVANTCVHKLRMKEVLQKGTVNVPAFTKIKSNMDLLSFIDKVGYPVVIKPVDNSGARGVLYLTRDVDIDWAFDYAKTHSFSGDVMAEKFISGLQISTEGIMLNDIFHCTGFADRNYERMEQFAPHIIEDGANMPTALDSQGKLRVEREFEKAIRVLGIDWGPAKGDMVLGVDGQAYVVEIAARLSGGNFCYDQVPLAYGVDIVDILIDMSVGNDVDAKRFEPIRNFATAQRYFFPPPGRVVEIRNIPAAEGVTHIKKVDIWVKPGDTIPDTISHPSRVGYVIACAPTKQEAVDAAERAIRTIEFILERVS